MKSGIRSCCCHAAAFRRGARQRASAGWLLLYACCQLSATERRARLSAGRLAAGHIYASFSAASFHASSSGFRRRRHASASCRAALSAPAFAFAITPASFQLSLCSRRCLSSYFLSLRCCAAADITMIEKHIFSFFLFTLITTYAADSHIITIIHTPRFTMLFAALPPLYRAAFHLFRRYIFSMATPRHNIILLISFLFRFEMRHYVTFSSLILDY